MLADALDFVLELDGKRGDVGTLALGAEGVGFAAHFLQNETEVLALGAAFLEGVQEKLVVAAEAGDFFVNVKLVGHDAGFLQQADIVDMVYRHKLRLLSMNESGADLESLYMQLTEEDEVNVR